MAFAPDHAQAQAACKGASLVLMRIEADGATRAACAHTTLIDAAGLRAAGGGAVRQTATGLGIERAIVWGGERPWSGPLARARPAD